MKKVKRQIPRLMAWIIAILMTTTIVGQETNPHGDITISGVVKDYNSGQSLEYANIIAQ